MTREEEGREPSAEEPTPSPEVAEALDLASSPARLDELSRSPLPEVRRGVAANASARADALLRLASEFPQEVIDNPALPLLLVSDMGAIWSLAARTLEIVIHQATIPERVLRVLLGHPSESLRVSAAASERVPEPLLGELAADSNPEVRRAAARNPRVPPGSAEALARDALWQVRQAAASRAGASASQLAALARDACSDVRMAAAANTATPPEALTLLARDPKAWVRRAVASNAHSPPEALAALADDPDFDVRRLHKKHPSA